MQSVRIGVDVNILPFVRIGSGAVIAAGSVVTRGIPAAVVADGQPAVACRRVADLPLLDSQVVTDASSVSLYRLRSGRAGGVT